jgi:NADPH:quinone reductase
LIAMLAARYDTSGPEQGRIRIEDVPVPEPGPGEVLVRVEVSGVNPTDWKTRTTGGLTAGSFDVIVPNQDGAGELEAVGPGVDHARVGELVWLYECQWQRAQGSAAQFIVLPEHQAVPLPERATLDDGAGLGIPAMTAHRALFADGPIDGDAVLVHGGAGAVGHAAIQLAVWAGARVAATVSSAEKGELARGAGAELVVNYREQDVAAAVRDWAPDGVRRIVEVDLRNLPADAAVIGDGGGIGAYARGDEPVEMPWDLFTRNATLDLVLVYTMPAAAKQAAIDAIGEALRSGALRPLPFTRFPLEQTQAAHEAVEAGAVGKVLVDVRA